MNAKKFSDALSALDGRYVEEAARYRRKARAVLWVRWGAAAACLCLLAAGGALLIQGRGRAAPDLSRFKSRIPSSQSRPPQRWKHIWTSRSLCWRKRWRRTPCSSQMGTPPWDRWTMRTAPSFVSSMGVETSAESTAAHWRRAERLRASASHTTNTIVCRMPSGK